MTNPVRPTDRMRLTATSSCPWPRVGETVGRSGGGGSLLLQELLLPKNMQIGQALGPTGP